MTDNPRLWQMLDELLDSQATPEDVCSSCPELLPEVRERWRQLCRVQAELDALFPNPPEPGTCPPALPPEGTALPQIPGYQVEAVLGRGGMGVVFRARHLRLNRVVALKMTLADVYAGPHERERFQREAEAVARLRHPNVVQVYDVGDTDGRPYFTMEFVEGGSLDQKLEGTPQPARQAAELLATLAEAVQAAHACGIIHRDLKPANVLLTGDGTPKITDFGLARRLDGEAGLTRTGTALGTPSYMAPEQAWGKKDAVGPAADIYALGAILYECLTGRPPFLGETAAETVLQVVHQEPVPPSRLNAKVPRDLETICTKCLHKEPRLRYASAAALAEDLDRFLRGEAIAARPEGRLERLARRARRRPVLSAALAAGTLFAVALLAGALWLMSLKAATERAADGDLRDMVGCLKKSAWPEARAALERARGRLGDGGPAELRRLLDQGNRDLELAARLDDIRLKDNPWVRNFLDFARADEAYEEAFRRAGFGQVHDDPEVVAARIAVSNIPNALVAAFDHWSACAKGPRRKDWVLSVAARAGRDPTGWRDRARDPAIWRDEASLARVIETAPPANQSVPFLLALERNSNAANEVRVRFLKRLQRAHSGDFWVNYRLGAVMSVLDKPQEAVGYFQAALAVRPEASIVHNNLAASLVATGRRDEAVEQYRKALAIDPTVRQAHYNLGITLSGLGRHAEAIEQIAVAIRYYPRAAILHTALGYSLEATGRHVEALAHHRKAVALEPKRTEAQKELRNFLMRQGRVNEVRLAWRAAIEANPLDHGSCYGYAEFCLFLGQEDEYRHARQVLLARFGASTDPYVAERTSRACLLLPATGDELRQPVALAERAAGVERAKYRVVYPAFLFAQGLAEYRQGRFDRAIAAMRGDASRVLGPAPRLVLAMALHRSGQVAEARKTLAAAVRAHDWRTTQVRDQDGWICHVLRREAEGMILPKQ